MTKGGVARSVEVRFLGVFTGAGTSADSAGTSSCFPTGIATAFRRGARMGICCHRIISTLCVLEGESTGEHHRSTGDAGCRDLCDAWIRSPTGQSGWIEFIAGIFEAWMVKDVFRIHPKLQFA